MDVAVGPRVVVNERTGSIIISGDVEIGPVVVTHGNMVIQAGVPNLFLWTRPNADDQTQGPCRCP